MRIGFGFLTCERHPLDGRSHTDIYVEALVLAGDVERLGFDSIWVPEHHFWDDGYVSSPLLLCSAIAARTRTIVIGTGMLIAPLYHPLRLAEDVATLDLISGGRFVVGLGLGWRPEEFDALGVSRERVGPRVATTVETLRAAWSPHELISGVSVTPKPTGGGPPVWLGGRSEAAMRRAARVGDGFLATASTPERFGTRVQFLTDELTRVGRDPDTFAMALFVPVFAWPSNYAWEIVRDAYHFATWKYTDMAQARGRRPPSALPPRLGSHEEMKLRRSLHIGSAEELAAALRVYAVAADVEIELIVQGYWPGLDPAVQRESICYFAQEVIPLLQP